jgi:glutamine synthetase
MSASFAQHCGVADAGWQAAVARTTDAIRASGVEWLRVGWCDLHGGVRSKTLSVRAALSALHQGVGMPSTLLLKDTADRTAYKVFEPGGTDGLPGFAGAGNVVLLPDPASFQVLPWLSGTGWLRCQAWFPDGAPVSLDSRHLLRQATQRLAGHGLGLVCGLEVEFHIYRLKDPLHGRHLDPALAGWPGPAPDVSLIHPGFHMLSDHCMDMSDEPLRIVRQTAQALGLPLLSVEVEFGPSQVEAVFDVTDALTAADHMVLFRNAVRQALHRAGYHATFMCRPPFEHIMSSGWHLHQSVVALDSGRNAFVREAPAPGSTPVAAEHTLSDTGAAWLAGLLHHAPGMTALCTPTANGYGRFQANALAPDAVVWGLDNRGAMLRVVGGAGQAATRIENRLGEPAANPYVYLAAQIHAGLDGLIRRLAPPPATESPYATEATRLPRSLPHALQALAADAVLCQGLGAEWVASFQRAKQLEHLRRSEAPDVREFDRREYFNRL